MLKHVVFIKFKPGTAEEQIEDIEKSLGRLPRLIPEIEGYEFGRDLLHSERSYDFSLVSAFNDMASMLQYQRHPDHAVVVDKIKRISESILSVDFEY